MSDNAAMRPEGGKCGGKTRSGGLCGLPAGHGTDHVGRGRCKLHGGSTPSHERKAAREEAFEFVAGQIGYEAAEIDPIAAATQAVQMASGAVIYWKGVLAEAYRKGEGPPSKAIEGYRAAMADLARMADVASKAGVAERLLAITERTAEQIALAFEDALSGEKIAAEQRARIVEKFGRALIPLEGGGGPLELTA